MMKNFTQISKKIIGIGRNYKAHAIELGHAVPTRPMFFLKPTSSFLTGGGEIRLPKGSDVHHEIELAVVIGEEGADISKQDAMKHVAGYALALDMTARDIQRAAAKAGDPWTVAKGYDTFTPISEFIPKSKIPDVNSLKIWCKVDNVLKQSGSPKDMIFDISSLIAHVSSIMKLESGDVILTGTPEGVGSLKPGQTIDCGLSSESGEQIARISFKAVER